MATIIQVTESESEMIVQMAILRKQYQAVQKKRSITGSFSTEEAHEKLMKMEREIYETMIDLANKTADYEDSI